VITQLTKSENDFLNHFSEEVRFFVRGTLPERRNFSVAMVGTRKPTAYGERTAYNIAYELARQGVTVISGLAMGIDTMAHRGAIDGASSMVGVNLTPEPKLTPTIAVLAGGVDKITPQQNQGLGEQIVARGGAIISEYPDNTEVTRWRLLERNRIVSGLADAVIIVEAAGRSGTLATARHAMRQGRPVFVVAGRLTDAMSAGCLYLLEKYPRQVRVFTSVANLLKAVAPEVDVVKLTTDSPEAADSMAQRVKQLMDAGKTPTEMTMELGLTAGELAQVQTELELFG